MEINDTNAARANSRRSLKIGLLILGSCLVLAATAITLFILNADAIIRFFSPKPRDFSCEGMTITLTDEFRQREQAGYIACYDSKNVAVFCLKEDFTDIDGAAGLTEYQYAKLVINATPAAKGATILTVAGLSYFEYSSTNPDSGNTYVYCTYVFKSQQSFWVFQFTTLEENGEDYMDSFLTWAKSVSFDPGI